MGMVTNEPATDEESPVTEYPPLTDFDRCDIDGDVAKAYVRVAKNGKELMFCSHHFSSHEPALLTDGWIVVSDRRSVLQARPGASA
jgi:hypothetical protein